MLQFYNDKWSQERNSKTDNINIFLNSSQKINKVRKENLSTLECKDSNFQEKYHFKNTKKTKNIMNKILLNFSNSILSR
jgi:hypothetical protein